MNNSIPVGVYIAQIKQLQGRICQKIITEHPQINLEKLNSAQMNILFQLWFEDNITISRLADLTKLANTTLSNMLDRLEQQNMITRIQNSSNRRETLVSLTQKAKDLYTIYKEVEKKMVSITLKDFDEREISLFKNMLLKVKTNLEEWENQEKNVRKN